MMNNNTYRKKMLIKNINEETSKIKSAIFSLTNQMLDSVLADLIIQTPFISGSPNAIIDAGQNALIFAAAKNGYIKALTLHSPKNDSDIFIRIKPLCHFSGGNKRIQRHYECLLALVTLEDMYKDREVDRMLGKYNPINSGAWAIDQMREYLEEEIKKVRSECLEELFPVKELIRFGWG